MPMRKTSLILLVSFTFCLSSVHAAGSPGSDQAGQETAAHQVDLQQMASDIVGDADSDRDKAEKIIVWLNKNFTWTDTDYRNRSVEEITARRGGNCAEQVRVTRALLDELGIPTRNITEINVQPESEQRQKDAEEVVSKWGVKGSVFGLRHNDHRWIEFYDSQARAWTPADPSLGLLGLESWLMARVGFDSRPTHHILPARDMLVPFCIFATDDRESRILEDRSKYYLIEQFNHIYGGKLAEAPPWPRWEQLAEGIAPHCKGALLGQENLHHQTDAIEQIGAVYKALRRESTRAK